AVVGGHRELRSFPTRRSSDLGTRLPGVLYDGGRWFGAAERLAAAAQHDQRVNAQMFDQAVGALQVPAEPDEPTVPRLPESLDREDRKSTRLNSSHVKSSYAVF